MCECVRMCMHACLRMCVYVCVPACMIVCTIRAKRVTTYPSSHTPFHSYLAASPSQSVTVQDLQDSHRLLVQVTRHQDHRCIGLYLAANVLLDRALLSAVRFSGNVHFQPRRFAIFKWYENECVCVCVCVCVCCPLLAPSVCGPQMV